MTHYKIEKVYLTHVGVLTAWRRITDERVCTFKKFARAGCLHVQNMCRDEAFARAKRKHVQSMCTDKAFARAKFLTNDVFQILNTVPMFEL